MRAIGFFVICCVLAAIVPLLSPRQSTAPAEAAFPGWPAQFEGRALVALPLAEREQRFAAGFPGRIGRFTDGAREIVMRWVAQETRALHPAADCFRGLGYTVRLLPVRVDERGQHWGSFAASRDNETLRVYERIYETDGAQSWADVSSWYWRALLGQTRGAWWAVTVAER